MKKEDLKNYIYLFIGISIGMFLISMIHIIKDIILSLKLISEQ